MTLLRLWLLATTVFVVGVLVWAFAPVMLFVLLLVGGLGVVSAGMILIARALEAWRARRSGTHKA